MQPDEPAHDRKAEAGSLIRPVIRGAGLKKGIAEIGEIIARYADSGVGNGDR